MHLSQHKSLAHSNWSLHSRWNFISTFTELQGHGDECGLPSNRSDVKHVIIPAVSICAACLQQATEIAEAAVDHINCAAKKLRKLFLVEDIVDSIKASTHTLAM